MPVVAGGGTSQRQHSAVIRTTSAAAAPLPAYVSRVYAVGSTAASGDFTSPEPTGGIQTAGGGAWSRAIIAAGSGAAQIGGSAVISRLTVRTYISAGGVTLAGSAAISRRTVKTASTSGGFQTAGAASLSHTEDVTPTGGISLAGSAAKARTWARGGNGAVQTSGSATVARGRVVVGLGGVLSGGAAQHSRSRAAFVTGGAQTAGSAITDFVFLPGTSYDFGGSGGKTLSGLAATSLVFAAVAPAIAYGFAGFQPYRPPPARVHEYRSTGGVSLGGNATTDFIPVITWKFEANGGIFVSGGGRSVHANIAAARAQDEAVLLLVW